MMKGSVVAEMDSRRSGHSFYAVVYQMGVFGLILLRAG
jgi:hypothetical protein